MEILWILISILSILVVFWILMILLVKHRKKPLEPDYKTFFSIGMVWTIFGIIFWNEMKFFLIMGIAFLIIGLANKDKWKKNQRRWKDLNNFEKRIKITIVIFLGILVLAGLVFFMMIKNPEQPIGGQTDENGCLGSAGYSFNENINACVRSWELNENTEEAAKLAVDFIGYEKGLTIIEVTTARCPGCFVVKLEKGKNRFDITLENWVVISKSLTPDDCLQKGGRNLNIVGGETCLESEINLGNVTGFISPNICCANITNFKECVAAGYPIAESYPRQCSDGENTFVEEV